MRTILHFLKPYWLNIVLIILFLFIQANADLSLPDYLSRIVNVGIQQSGIEADLPAVMRKSTFEALQKLLQMEARPEDFTALQEVYIEVLPDSPKAQSLSKKWPIAKKESIMMLSSEDKAELDAARKVFLSEYPKLAAFLQFSSMAASKASPQMSSSDLSGLSSMTPQELSAQIEALDPIIKSQIIVLGLQGEFTALGANIGAMQRSYILRVGIQMLLITLITVGSAVSVGFLGSRLSAGTSRDLRNALFSKVEEFSLAEFDSFSTASLITRSTNDIQQIQMLIMMSTRMLFYAPIIGIGGIIRALGKASGMWWIIAMAVGALLAIIGLVFALVVPKFRIVQKLMDRLNLVVRENLSGMMVIRSFNMQDQEAKRFDKANRDLTDMMLYVTRAMVVLMPLMTIIMNVVSISIIWVGSHEVAVGSIRIGDMMAFMQYSMQIFFAFLMMSAMFILFPRASVSAERVAEVLDKEVSIRDPEKPVHLSKPVKGEIEFHQVDFKYPGAQEQVLEDISFIAKPGTMTAIIGTTGSGKSTLVSLIPRLYDVTGGQILLDGIDIRNLPLSELRAQIGFVPQKSILFSGDIEENIRYGKENALENEIMEALEVSQVLSLVEESPEGLKRPISQGGMNVSGGQRQRLAIARALVRKAPIYIFDDSFSAIDYKTDRAIRSALKRYAADSTIFLVTQRVAPIRHAEQIIVLHEGQIVGIGMHEQLMKTCTVYRDIALSQLKQEELV
ncbi:MAG: ABC transporter ATP-binding protein [Spirochaetota bacterium]|nr:ABC transporter ATP-binding protein [Spirochaetota bacterium]HNP92477.1 ABC transporter ATP-binding protein [Rectinema sp.]HPB60862.1 ABC transporter ATP-binding protein [Rectinema sp.]HQN02405.1 ABC transporter ATP-binding protein [Rectinema sp.]